MKNYDSGNFQYGVFSTPGQTVLSYGQLLFADVLKAVGQHAEKNTLLGRQSRPNIALKFEKRFSQVNSLITSTEEIRLFLIPSFLSSSQNIFGE